jgi:hypothetical protein
MNIYILIALGYVLPAIVSIGVMMYLTEELTSGDVCLAAVPCINVTFAITGILLMIADGIVYNKVIWRKK